MSYDVMHVQFHIVTSHVHIIHVIDLVDQIKY